MNGWQRFGLLVLGCFIIMVLYPNFDRNGLHFIGFTLLVGTGAILLLSVISNLFAIYRFAFLNKIITLAVLGAIIYVLLWHFPQTDGLPPIAKLRAGHTPTQADIEKGIRQVTFNFDFVRRNVRRAENFSNQHPEKEKNKSKQVQAPKEPEDVIEVFDDEYSEE